MILTKPWYQRAAVPVVSAFGGLLVLGAVLDAVSNARALISPFVTYTGTAFLIAFALTLQLYLRKRPLVWVSKGGQGVRISRLGYRPLGAIGGAILLLWVPRLAFAFNERSDTSIPEYDEGSWCYGNALEGDGDEVYEANSQEEVDDFSLFLMENEGNIVRLELFVCPEAVLDDTIKLGTWPAPGLELVIQEPENGDIVWNPVATGSYGLLQGYFVVLEASGELQRDWLTVHVRPVRIENALLSQPRMRPRRPEEASESPEGGD
jgi:hypothetical protein